MIVQESGVAVGWPLNLGHDTTGWPLGLRLRLMQEDLKCPRMPDLARSSSRISTDSSSLDTTSTRSFFQDKSISLGALIGIPMLDSVGNCRYQYLQHGASLGPSNAPSRTPMDGQTVQTANNPVKRSPKSRLSHRQRQHPYTSLTTQASPSAASSTAGWSLRSVLNCARVPAEIEAPAETSIIIPHSQQTSSLVQDSELEVQKSHESSDPPKALLSSNSSHQQRSNPLARKLYDNITFEEEEPEITDVQRGGMSGISSDGSSSEWNPLFTSFSQQARDEDVNEDNDDEKHDRSLAMAAHCHHYLQERHTLPLVELARCSSDGSDDSHPLLHYSRGCRVRIGCPNFFLDVGKWQQKQRQLGHEKSQQLVDNSAEDDSQLVPQPARDSSRNKAVSAFISRMVWCRSTLTRESSSFY